MKIRTYLTIGTAVPAISLSFALLINGQQPHNPDHTMSEQQMGEMNRRGDKAMGFDHLKTTHHFILKTDGGLIKVEANDEKDLSSRDQIRKHLGHIAMMFGEGNFQAPMLVHAETPPGTEVMQKLKAEISYEFQETERGALIRISTSNADALQAVHDFLRYQITEHKTGDPLQPSAETDVTPLVSIRLY